MNLNQTIKSIKDEIGITKFIKTTYDDYALYDIIKNITIPTFSRYYPAIFTPAPFFLTSLNKVDTNVAYYKIPETIIKPLIDIESEILGLAKFELFNQSQYSYNSGNYYGAPLYNTCQYGVMMDLYSYAANGEQQIKDNYYFDMYYERPNMIKLVFDRADVSRYVTSKQMLMSFYVKHTNDMFTINQGLEHDFYKLCKLDIMIVLYNNETKFVESVSTGIGNLNLKIDEWANAQSTKDELLNKFTATSAWYRINMKTF